MGREVHLDLEEILKKLNVSDKPKEETEVNKSGSTVAVNEQDHSLKEGYELIKEVVYKPSNIFALSSSSTHKQGGKPRVKKQLLQPTIELIERPKVKPVCETTKQTNKESNENKRRIKYPVPVKQVQPKTSVIQPLSTPEVRKKKSSPRYTLEEWKAKYNTKSKFEEYLDRMEIRTGVIEYGVDLRNSPFIHLLLTYEKGLSILGIKCTKVIRKKDITSTNTSTIKTKDIEYKNILYYINELRGVDDYQVIRDKDTGELVLKIFSGNTVEEHRGYIQVKSEYISPSIEYCIYKYWAGHYEDTVIPLNNNNSVLEGYYENKLEQYRRGFTKVMGYSDVISTELRTLGSQKEGLNKTINYNSDSYRGIKEFFRPNNSTTISNKFAIIQRGTFENGQQPNIIRLNADGSVTILRLGLSELYKDMYPYRHLIYQVKD